MIPDDDPLDPDILSAIQGLAPYPARDPEMEAHGVEIFLAAARLARDSHSQATIPAHNTLARLACRSKASDHRSKARRPWLRALAALSILLMAIFGASGATSLAAREALPGDALYPVKTIVEDARIQLSSSASKTTELHILFANRRLDELSLLAAEQRYDNLDSTIEQLRYHSQEAVQSMKQVANDDPVQAQELAAAITDLLAENVNVLTSIRAAAPESAAPAINQTLNAIQLSPGGSAAFDGGLVILPAATTLPPLETPPPETMLATGQAPQALNPTPTDKAPVTPARTLEATPQETPTLSPVGIFDLDVERFKADSHVELDKAQTIQILLDIKNNGLVGGQGSATVTGVQSGVEIYNQSLPVSGDNGSGKRSFHFPSFVPTASGEIVWTVTLVDDDPDEDKAVEVTMVSGASDPGGGQPESLDLDIYNFKITSIVKLKKVKPIEIRLDLQNNGAAGSVGSVTITGVQNGLEVYSQSWTISDLAGSGQHRSLYASYVPGSAGEIVWTITLEDDDPDDDILTSVTQVEP